MCVPDLLGTQGTFLLFTTRPPASRFKEGGVRVAVALDGDRIDTTVEGPENTFARRTRRRWTLPIAHRHRSRRRHAWTSTLGGTARRRSTPGELSDWVTLRFRGGARHRRSRASPACS